MTKPKNQVKSVVIRITTTPNVRRLLERLVDSGLYGKNVAEAAERLVARSLEQHVKNGVLMNQTVRGEDE